MKKNLIAIAVGAAIVMPGVALADAKVYGRFNIALDSQKDEIGLDFKNDGETSWKFRDAKNSSRFGVKGKDDLGIGGLEGFYQMEWGVDPTGDGVEGDIFTRRNIFVGVRGGFGSLKVGFYDTLIKEAGAAVDIFNDTPGDIDALMAGEQRLSNMLTYTTPKFADAIELSVAIQPGEGRTAGDDIGDVEDGIADTIFASAKYETDMFQATLAYAGNQITDLKLDKGTAAADIIRASAVLKLRDLELGALYQIADGIDQDGTIDDDEDPVTPEVAGPFANGGERSDSSFMLSAAYTLSAVKLKGMYALTNGDTNDKDRTELALGVDYKLNKSTYMSLYYITFEDDAGGGDKPTTDTIGTALVYSF
ncbi:MAG: porin [Pseudomonadota bacterium]|nr:porin [Pseudomonadota bacterium]